MFTVSCYCYNSLINEEEIDDLEEAMEYANSFRLSYFGEVIIDGPGAHYYLR